MSSTEQPRALVSESVYVTWSRKYDGVFSDNRPEFEVLLAFIRNGKGEAIGCTAVYPFSRVSLWYDADNAPGPDTCRRIVEKVLEQGAADWALDEPTHHGRFMLREVFDP